MSTTIHANNTDTAITMALSTPHVVSVVLSENIYFHGLFLMCFVIVSK